MTHNWRELPEVIKTCNRLECSVYFNVVYYPKECSFTSLTRPELENVRRFLESERRSLPTSTEMERNNLQAYEGVINLLDHWLETGAYVTERFESLDGYFGSLRKFIREKVPQTQVEGVAQKIEKKVHFLLEKAEEQGKRKEAEEKLIAVAFQDMFDYTQHLEEEQLLDNFRNFILPME